MLLATSKLFFKTPGEIKKVIKKFYEIVLNKYQDVDLRDKVYFYYNLLKNQTELAEFIIAGEAEKNVVDKYYDDLEGETLVRILLI
jgi:hypothetical protein